MHRLFCDANLEPDQTVVISREDLHHVRDVLRLRDGEMIELVDPRGIKGTGTAVRRDGLFEIRCSRLEAAATAEEGGEITLYMGLAKGEKFELIIQKTVELGVSKIVPVAFERCVVRLDGRDTEKKLARWRRIAREAAMQSGRIRVPEIMAPQKVADVCAQIQNGQTLLAWEMEKECSLKEALRKTDKERPLGVIVGPEGGIDEKEAKQLTDAGAVSVSLGSRILRCETAPIALLSVIEYERGGMELRR